MITEEIIEARMDNLKFEEWRGTSDGLYHLSFLKVFNDCNFTPEQLFSLLMKRLENERDISIMEIQSRMNDIPEEPCNCDECKAERGETEPEL